MIGPAGIGKSELFSFGNSLYLQFEAGLNHLKVMKVPVTTWEEFSSVYSALVQAKEKGDFPWDTIVIDTIDRMIDVIDQEVLRIGRERFKTIAIHSKFDIPNGNGWMWSSEMVENVLRKMEILPAAIAYIGHLERKEVKEPTSSHHIQTISIGGKLGGNLVAWPDHLLNITADYVGEKKVRVVRTMPTKSVEAKSRGSVIPDGWRWADSGEENYKKLRGFFQ